MKQRGDTIVEVLIALSVIGLTLAAAFGLANTAARTGRNAQERAEALKIAESQLELTKAYIKVPANMPPTGNFCIDPSGGNPVSETDPKCKVGFYTILNEDLGSGTYKFAVTWDRVNTESDVRGLIDLYYRVGPL